MKRPIYTLLALVGLVSLIGGTIWLLQMRSTETVEASVGARTAVLPTDTVEVTRRDLTEEVELNGTLSYGEPFALPIDADGIVTDPPSQDDVIEPGSTLIHVDNRPIVLAHGSVPLYRELRRVGRFEVDDAGDKLSLQEGDDVEQLQRFLLEEGFDDEGRLEVDGVFGITTERAVKDWQRSIERPATGRVDRSQLVFVDGSVRVESAPPIGGRFDQITVGAVRPIVQLDVSARQRAFFAIGAPVSIESDAGVATGTVTVAKRSAGADGSTRYAVEVEFDDESAGRGIESATVTSTRVLANDVTTLPVRALVALAEGGWAVQVEGPTGLQLTGVELGQVVDGIAEIVGLDEGTVVVIPA
ncbi:MAG: peptidoglycan-binding domain-containing protein [Acidimicrobiia bacterium]|nr:peptidoglycan-binding domain-containing protein [Acidimicrobiia bacterium]